MRMAVGLQAVAGIQRCAAGAAAEQATFLRACSARVQAAACAQVRSMPRAAERFRVYACALTPAAGLLLNQASYTASNATVFASD
jgi:hypothetical protein